MYQKGFAHILLILIIGIIALGGVYYLGTHNTKLQQTRDSFSQEYESYEVDDAYNPIPEDWPRYVGRNSIFDFSISYPDSHEEWEYREFTLENPDNKGLMGYVQFRPVTITEDYLWSVGVYSVGSGNPSSRIEILKSQIGSQFEDREQKEEYVQLALGIEGTLVTTKATLPGGEEWVSKVVYYVADNKGASFIYEISDGAMQMPEFIKFYSSFYR